MVASSIVPKASVPRGHTRYAGSARRCDPDGAGSVLEAWERLCRLMESVAETFRCAECPQLGSEADEDTRDFVGSPPPQNVRQLRERERILHVLVEEWRANSNRLPLCPNRQCCGCKRRTWRNLREN